MHSAWAWPDRPFEEWTRAAWNWLHCTGIFLPEEPSPEEARAACARIHNFVRTLPCQRCAVHAGSYVARHPPDCAGSEALQRWAWGFHNAVNARLKKPELSYEGYRALYAEEILWARLMAR